MDIIASIVPGLGAGLLTSRLIPEAHRASSSPVWPEWLGPWAGLPVRRPPSTVSVPHQNDPQIRESREGVVT
jgi:hypothetical protein